MRLPAAIRRFASAFFERSRMKDDIDEELLAHIQDRVNDLERRGLAREQAQRRARLEFGGYQKFREECHEAAGAHLLETLLHDARYGLRVLRKAPGFTKARAQSDGVHAKFAKWPAR